ncbi:hypothetical protein ACTXGQ_17880 [Marinobacter sp. 1Y8]
MMAGCLFTSVAAGETAFGPQVSELEHNVREAKPLTLNIRYGLSTPPLSADQLTPPAAFLDSATAVDIAVAADDSGIVHSANEQITYSLQPSKDEPHRLDFNFSQETPDGSSSFNTAIAAPLNQWLTVGMISHDEGQGTAGNFYVLVRLSDQ